MCAHCVAPYQIDARLVACACLTNREEHKRWISVRFLQDVHDDEGEHRCGAFKEINDVTPSERSSMRASEHAPTHATAMQMEYRCVCVCVFELVHEMDVR
eukprot:1159130-Pelagomonas_calceolata.AAC.2